MPLGVVGGIIPLAVLVAVLVPAERPVDSLTVPEQALLLGVPLYRLCFNGFGLQKLESLAPVAPHSRFSVLVPAHNEDTVIAYPIAGLRAQAYPAAWWCVLPHSGSRIAHVSDPPLGEDRAPPESHDHGDPAAAHGAGAPHLPPAGLGIAGVPIGYSWGPQEPAERPWRQEYSRGGSSRTASRRQEAAC